MGYQAKENSKMMEKIKMIIEFTEYHLILFF